METMVHVGVFAESGDNFNCNRRSHYGLQTAYMHMNVLCASLHGPPDSLRPAAFLGYADPKYERSNPDYILLTNLPVSS